MEQTFLEKAISFLSNHFELLVYINASIAALFLLTYIAVKFSDVKIRKIFRDIVRGVLFTTIVVGQVTLFVILGYLYWKNYQKPAPELKFEENISGTTYWVKDDLRVYFIDDTVLRSVKINGKGKKDIFKANETIKEYYFSPDGASLLVLTQNSLFLVDRKTTVSRYIDGLKKSDGPDGQIEVDSTGGSISGIQWSPDSKKFIYEIARWSKYAAQDNIYIYFLRDQTKESINSPTRRISSLYWGLNDGNIYFLRHEAQDPSEHAAAFEVKVFRVPLSTLKPEFVTQIPFDQFSVPIENLNLRGIELYFGGKELSFGQPIRDDKIVSEKDSAIGIDANDYIYFTKSKWFKKRLYKVPREIDDKETIRYHYKGGDLIIDHIRWIPGGRYVIMEHKHWGVLILEPITGRMGSLIQAHGRAFGWYQ